MKYIGKLYGKLAGKTFDTGKTSEDWDKLVETNAKLVEENERLEQSVQTLTISNKNHATLLDRKQSELSALNEENEKLQKGVERFHDKNMSLRSRLSASKERVKELEKSIWVRVEDRLPTKEGFYIVIREYSDVPVWAEFTGSVFTNYNGYKVTHWSHLHTNP